MRARGLTVALLASLVMGAVVTSGCQRVLGIHGSQLARSDAGAGGSTGGGTGGNPADASTDLRDDGAGMPDAAGTGGAPGVGGKGSGGAASGGSGAGGDGRADPDGGGTGDGGIDARPPDAGAPDVNGGGGGMGGGDAGVGATDAIVNDATADLAGTDGAPSDGQTPDAGACATPWQAVGVEARLLTPDTSGMTACSMPGSDVPTLAAAVDATNYRAGQACGACLRVEAALGTASVIVPVVEKSGANGVLLTKAAMDQLAPGASLTMVNWTLVACDVQQKPVHYYIKDGSNAGYVGIQIRNARYPVATAVLVGSKTTVPLALQPYDYWESTSAGGGPLTLRLTDINGQSFDDPGIKITPQTDMAGAGQFPLCH